MASISERDTLYERGGVTWVVFAALFAFGVLNAGLGPALPYIRSAEHISYVGGVLHQIAFAVGGGVAGLLVARAKPGSGRTAAICIGLGGAALAWLGVGYGNALVVTATAALLVSLLATSALVRLWAVLADLHGSRRTIAMTEGEVAVSLGGVLAPLLVGGLAATALGWRFAFVAGALVACAAAAACGAIGMPTVVGPPAPAEPPGGARAAPRLSPTLALVFAVVALEFSMAFWLASYLADEVGVHRSLAATMVSGLYAANLAGRLLTSRLARRIATERILAAAIALSLAGMPILLAATDAATAAAGLAVTGTGIGAMFPLTSSLHVGVTPRSADSAIGQVLATASIGQIVGPVTVAALAQAFDLRIGLLTMPALALAGAAALRAHVRHRDPRRTG